MPAPTQSYDTIVIGGGQAGLATGYYLKKLGRDFVILDERARTGDVWRSRWDSLCLFTYARFNGLPGMRFPAPADSFPTKDAMADYLEAYATRFQLPVRMGMRVEDLSREHGRFVVSATGQRFEADHVVVAMSTFQQPALPAFASELDPHIVQLHSSTYKNPAQLREGGVLIVGAGNSGAEIAKELAPTHPVWLSGRDTGHIPFRIEGLAARLFLGPLVLRAVFHHVLTVDNPLGRKARKRFLGGGGTLIRVKPKDLLAAGVRRVARVAGVRDGRPVLADGQAPDVTNIIWCTGFTPGFSWIHLPALQGDDPLQERGISTAVPELYFVGLAFQYSASSTMVQGVGRDAERVVRAIARSGGSKPSAVASQRQVSAM